MLNSYPQYTTPVTSLPSGDDGWHALPAQPISTGQAATVATASLITWSHPNGRTHYQIGRFLGNREGDRSAFECEGIAGGITAGAIQLAALESLKSGRLVTVS